MGNSEVVDLVEMGRSPVSRKNTVYLAKSGRIYWGFPIPLYEIITGIDLDGRSSSEPQDLKVDYNFKGASLDNSPPYFVIQTLTNYRRGRIGVGLTFSC